MPEQATLPPPVKVTGPGVYEMTAAEYHADPVPGGSLSSTGARKLLAPSCPALFKHALDSGEPPRAVFDEGAAAHAMVLGTGPELVLVDRDRWDTKAVKEEIAGIRARGAVPLKRGPYDAVHAMAAALREHPYASRLFAPGTGEPERALVWAEYGNWEEDVDGEMVPRTAWVRCRALVDWLPKLRPGRLILPDYKSCVSAAPVDLEKAMARFGYHVQLEFYLRGMRALNLADEHAVGVLVAQEKTPPYLVTVVQPSDTAMRVAAMRVREALDTYARCTATGRWPGYSDDVVLAELPPWETRELDGAVW